MINNNTVRNRPLGTPEYFLEYAKYTKNLIVSSTFHGTLWVLDGSNLSVKVQEIQFVPLSGVGFKLG